MPEIKLKINDGEVPLNEMMREMLINIILGYLKAAKGIPSDKKSINIEIEL